MVSKNMDSKTRAMAKMSFKLLILMMTLFSSMSHGVEGNDHKIDKIALEKDVKRDPDENTQNEALDLVNQVEKNIKNNESQGNGSYKDEYQEFARSINNRFVADKPDFSKEIATKEGIDIGEILARYYPEYQGAQANIKNEKNGKNIKKYKSLLVFISLSMPKNAILQLADQVRLVSGVMVLRGLVEGSILKTSNLIKEMSEKSLPIIIDPTLFTDFLVDRVPTMVLLADDYVKCEVSVNDPFCSNTPIHDRISGNISLDYALEQMAARGHNKEIASNYLKLIRGSL
jgi:type-F conjugative transfer system pilin assembly protein TrbC